MEKTIVPLNQVRRNGAWHFPIFSAEVRAAEAALESSPYPLVPLRQLVKKTERGFPGVGKSHSESLDIPLLSIRNITHEGVIIENSNRFISNDEHGKLNKSAVQPDDVLITLSLGSRDSIAAVYETDAPANLTSHLALLRLQRKKLDPHYLVTFLNSSVGRSLITQRTTGSIQQSLTISQLLEIPIPLPPLAEQERLVQAVHNKKLQAVQREQEAIRLREEANELVEAFLQSRR